MANPTIFNRTSDKKLFNHPQRSKCAIKEKEKNISRPKLLALPSEMKSNGDMGFQIGAVSLYLL